MIKAIVYTSAAGHTKEYAELLGKKTGVKVVALDEADLESGCEIIYMGWLFAGNIKGCAKAYKKYTVCALCGVGMAPFSETLAANLQVKNVKNKGTAFFYLQGGFDLQKLSGLNKFIMRLKAKSIRKNLEAKDSLSPDEKSILTMVTEGASAVRESNLAGITEWCRTKTADT